MSRYDELRVFYGRIPDERMALLEREMRAPIAEACRLAAEIVAVDMSVAPALFGGRLGELIEILGISAARLGEVAGQAPAVRERARAAGQLRDEDIHAFRHDLLTPIGTLRGVAGMLARADIHTVPALPPDLAARARALAAAIDELCDVLDALTDVRGRV
jgi:signal transduction histidine kinase